MSVSPGRIVFVNRVYWPSTEATAQLLTDLASGLAARGHAVHVIASAADTAGADPAGVTIHRTGAAPTSGGLLGRALAYRRFLREARAQLQSLLQPGDVVVALTDPPMLGAMVTETAAACGARVVHWVQDIYPEIARTHFGAWSAPLLAPLRARRDRAWRHAAACVTVGDDMAGFLTRRGVPAQQVAVVPNWFPRGLETPPDAAAVQRQRAAWGVADSLVIAYSGNLGRVHEFTTLLDAAEALRAEPRFAWLFIGRGPRYADVQREARRRGLNQVRFLPPVPRSDLAVALAAADVHCVTLQPAYGELVYPSKLAGVLAAGRPVLFVGPSDGDIARLVRGTGCGAAVAPGNAADLASALRSWQADPAALAQAASAARTEAARFAPDAALDRWEYLLRGLPPA